MSISEKINNDIKAAMLAKEKLRLEALRAVKSALLLAASEKGAGSEVTDEAAIKIIQKLVKQRKESAEIYTAQNRPELAEKELAEAVVLEQYLPVQMSESEIRSIVSQIISQTGASSPAEIGKVMGVATKQLAGKADGKLISAIARELLSK